MTEAAGTWPFDLPRSGHDAISYALDRLSGSLFREYDVRGRVDPHIGSSDATLDEFVSGRLGRAFGTYLMRRGKSAAVVGYDSRSYSEKLANGYTLGLLSTGVDVTSIGLATTPMVYFAQHRLGGIAGTSLTASHNPNGWSGLKLSDTPSLTLGPDGISELQEIASTRAFARGAGRYLEASITDDYVEYLATLLPAPLPLVVVLDGGNSISGPIGVSTLRLAGYDVRPLNERLDWTFPNHEPDPEAMEAREQVREAVRLEKADVGISLDGDGDRLGLTDQRGNVVWSDIVLALLARDALSRHPGSPIVYDVKCSRAVSDVIADAGGKPVMWKTGHSHIKAKMREIGAPFSGERSGHFFDAGDYFGYDDAVYSALRLLRIVADRGDTVSDAVATVPHYWITPTMQAECDDAAKYEVVDRFAKYAETIGANELIRINGVRAEFDDGWVLVRASSNLPSLVIIAEATTEARLDDLYRMARSGLDAMSEVSRQWDNDPRQESSVTS